MLNEPGRAALLRWVCAVVAAETGRLGGSAPLPFGDPPAESEAIGAGGLGLDSLGRMGALAALAEGFGLSDATLGAAPAATVGDWVDWAGQALRAPDAQVSVATSGSTGLPRACRHAFADLMAEARFFADALHDRRRIVALVPAHHLYGIIWTVLLPSVLGLPVVSRMLGQPLGLAPGDLVVAVPEQWRALRRVARPLPVDVAGVSSGGPLADEEFARLADAGFLSITDIYGASETGAIAWRNAAGADHRLLPRWQGIADGGETLVAVTGARFALPDRLLLTGARTIRLEGRRDGAVQIGGHNVWPAEVAAAVRRVAGVADAAIRLGANGRLKALVVPAAGVDPSALVQALDRMAAAHLAEPARPTAWRIAPALPRNAMGKLADWA